MVRMKIWKTDHETKHNEKNLNSDDTNSTIDCNVN